MREGVREGKDGGRRVRGRVQGGWEGAKVGSVGRAGESRGEWGEQGWAGHELLEDKERQLHVQRKRV